MKPNILIRRFYIRHLAPILAIAGAFCLSTCSKSPPQPNILFVLADDHAAHAISAYGSVINKTPNIDRLANEGIRFANAFCTNSICAPSRAAFLTGTYNHVNGVMDNRARFDSSQVTFPMLLQQAGYQTAVIGKWHLKSEPAGFDYWNVLPGQGAYYNPDMIEMGERRRYQGYVTDVITDLVLDWLQRRNPEKPFCLLYQHKAPHRNWMPGPAHLSLYDDTNIPEPETLFDDYSTRSAAATEQEMTIATHLYGDYDLKLDTPGHADSNITRMWQNDLERMDESQRQAWHAAYGPKNATFEKAGLQGRPLTQWKYQRYIKDYLRTIASIDDNLGRVLDYLDQSGLAANTIVVYTSDQGFFLGDHGWFDKRFMYEESLRLPLIVRYPDNIRPSSINRDLVLNVDLAPTLLALAGAGPHAEMQGRSLEPLLQQQQPSDWRSAIYYRYVEYPAWHMVKKHYGVRTDRYKLIHFYDDIDAWEFFDLRRDPRELQNQIGNPAYAATIDSLKQVLAALQDELGDSGFLAEAGNPE